MITKELIKHHLTQSLGEGRDDLNAIQKCFELLLAEYPVKGIEEKTDILHGVIYYACELFKPSQPYGYKTFDLILSRTIPTPDTLEYIESQEGENIWSCS